MVLAAGLGTRLLPLTETTPKPLLSAGGRTLIEYQLERLIANGIEDVVINVHHLGEQIEAFVSSLVESGQLPLNVHFSREDEVLETGGGIRRALPMLGDEPFLVVSADTYIELSSFETLMAPLPEGMLGRLLMTSNPAHHPDGDFSIDAGGVLGATGACLTYTGFSLLSPALVRDEPLDVFALRPVFDRAIAAGRLLGQFHEGFWWDVGTVERLQALQDRLTDNPH